MRAPLDHPVKRLFSILSSITIIYQWRHMTETNRFAAKQLPMW